MNIPPMRAYLLLLLLLCFSGISLAQRPDSVQLNGEWYFIYPIEESLSPAYPFLKRTDLSELQCDVLLEWKLTGDSRAQLPKKRLEDSLNAELLRTNRILSKEQDQNNWEHGTDPPNYWGHWKESKKRMRRYPVLNVIESDPVEYDLVPSVASLPDGKYIQYFEPFLTYDRTKKMQVITGKTAAVFALKDNLPDGAFIRFNYHGDTVKQGFFSEGLREGTWFVKNDSYYVKSKSQQGIEQRCSALKIELKAGIPDGDFQLIIRGNVSNAGGFQNINKFPNTLQGHFSNGFAVGKWVNINRSFRKEYTSLIYGPDWVKDSLKVKRIYVQENAEKADGFDFAEMTNSRPVLELNEVELNHPMVAKTPKPISDFSLLFQNPMDYNLMHAGTPYYSENSEVALRFSGTLTSYWKNKMDQRVTVDKETHTLAYANFYLNGKLFDTLGYESSTDQFIYRMYDVHGKLYLQSHFNREGTILDRECFAVRKEPKVTKPGQPEIKYMEGHPATTELVYFEYKNTLVRIWRNKEKTITDGKQYKYIAWDYETNKRFREEYWLNDTLHDVFYNHKGDKTLDISRVKSVPQKQANKGALLYDRKYTLFWDNVAMEMNYDSLFGYKVCLLNDGTPFTGNLKLRFSNRKIKTKFHAAKNELVLICPPKWDAKKMNRRFVYANVYTIDKRNFMGDSRGDYYFSEASLLFQFLTPYFTEDVFDTHYLRELKGTVAKGSPYGNWSATAKNNELGSQVSFINNKVNGIIKHYTRYEKPDRFDRKWKEGDKYYYQKFSEKNQGFFLDEQYKLENGLRTGQHLGLGVNGDTLLRFNYKNGRMDGDYMKTASGDSLFGAFLNGKPHGNFVLTRSGATTRDTVLLAPFSNGNLNGLLRYEYRELLNIEEEGNNSALIMNAEFEKRKITVNYQNGLADGKLLVTTKTGIPMYGLTLNKNEIDTVFFYENSELSFYFDRLKTPTSTERVPPVDSLFLARHDFSTVLRKLQTLSLESTHPESEMDYLYDTYLIKNLTEDFTDQAFGYLTKLYPNGKTARSGYRINDKNFGLWSYYGYEGNLLYTIDYSIRNNNNDTIGLYTEYAPDGTILSKRIVVEELEKYDCAHSDYYAIRQFEVIEDTPDAIDRSNGLQKNYFDNGVQMSEGNLENGLPDGVWKFFTPDGRLTIVGKYINGKKEGRWLYGDLGDKKYIGEICLNPDDPFLDFHIAELEKKKDIQVQIYKEGKAMMSQYHELNDR